MSARPTADAALPPRLELKDITKRYPGVLANDRISLSIDAGGVHALLGENGAGKSTLVKIIYGVVEPDGGELRWEGAPVTIRNPAHARRLGIGMVFQHFNLFDTLTVAENILLGLDDPPDLKALSQQVADFSDRYGLPIDPRRHVHALSVGERQRVEIIRCLLQNPKLLIMDEPTSVLTPQEADRLFKTLRRLADDGCSILYISHKLQEIRELCDDATVLRGGKVVATCDPREETPERLAAMMIGGEIPIMTRRDGGSEGSVRLEIRGLSLKASDPFGVDLEDVYLTVRAGEVVGIAGVTGNGQTELLKALSGERRVRPGDAIMLDGWPCGHRGPAPRRAGGLAFVPEERIGRGAVPDMSLAENALLTGHRNNMVRHGMICSDRARDFALEVTEDFDVRTARIDTEAHALSGGNLQKFIVGREVHLHPRVLVLAYPTWGVDVGAATRIHRAMMDLRGAGAAILVVSEDLDELFELCDRIAVLSRGRLSIAKRSAETTIDELGLWMAGQFDPARADDAVHAD